MFRRNGIFSLISFVLIIALIALGGYMLFNSGYSQGLLSGQAAVESGEAVPVQPGFSHFGRYYGPGIGLWGLGFFGLFFKFIIGIMIFSFIMRMFFRPMFWGWGPHAYGRKGWHGRKGGWGKPPWAYYEDDEDDEDGPDAEPASL